jgi:hypothetical protein
MIIHKTEAPSPVPNNYYLACFKAMRSSDDKVRKKKNAGATTALRSMIHEPTNFFPIVSIEVTLI